MSIETDASAAYADDTPVPKDDVRALWGEVQSISDDVTALIPSSAFLTRPRASTGLSRVLRIEILTSLGSIPISLPAQVTVREVARDNLDRFRLRLSSFDGASTYAEVMSANSGGGLSLNVAGMTGPQWVDLVATGTALGPANDAVVGSALINFGDGSPFGSYAATIDHAQGGVDPAQMQAGAIFERDVDERIDRAKPKFRAFLAQPGGSSALARIVDIELAAAVDGTPVSLPAQVTVRQIARDQFNRFRIRLAEFDGASTYTEIAGEGVTPDGSLSVTGFTGQKWIDIVAIGTSLGPDSGVVIGQALIDFGEGEVFGTYTALIDHAVGGVYPDQLQLSQRDKNDIAEISASVVKRTRGALLPFSDDFAGSDVLRDLVRGCHVYTRTDEPHALRFYFENFGGGSYRIRGEVVVVSSGQVICSGAFGPGNAASMAEFAAAQDTRRRFDDTLLALDERTRLFANFEFDWSVIADLPLTGGTTILGGVTVADGGLHESVVFGEERTKHLRMNPPPYGRVIRVGTGGDFTTLTAALASLRPRLGDLVINGRKVSDEAHPASPILVRMLEEGREEVSGLYMLDDVHIEGRGVDRTVLVSPLGSGAPVVENHGTTRLSGLTEIQQEFGEHCHHRDLVNNNIGQEGSDGITEHEPIVTVIENYRMVMESGSDNYLFGSGLSANDTIILRDVELDHFNPDPIDGSIRISVGFVHNSGPTSGNPSTPLSERPGLLVLDNVRTNVPVGWELATLEPSAVSHCRITSCSLGLLKVSTSSGTEVLTDLAKDRNQWVVGGLYEDAFLRDDPVGENVLKTTAGLTPSGDAAALIFGAVDDLGRGEKWIGDGNDYDLGSRLGDCSSVNKTLTIGGQTHTFTADETTKSNATLLDEINASLTNNPLSIVDIQLEWVPDAAPKRRVNNDTGVTIPKGRLVRFTGAGTVALCAAGERPDGWTHRDILNGDNGSVILTRCIADAYIESASASVGEWGISASGQLDYAAGVKLGRTIGGIVAIY